ncbi:hypothetical protein HK107_00900 [Parvularcula sp. ZS-1/3]|uniref:SRP54-type proteins GTP-binding domain-containing protein n=1 Tax=Parvularcula mediterranea TaxID=2732508 RepID=A0A7Y3RIT0_9PROT|nr:hypothetical protein [Parvularcula mediterranea]NNU14879.1 hypothetical protein [Parvularcula mediterranea]
MSYQTFTGANVDEAKRAMRRAMGPEGVVLSVKRAPGGGVELRAVQKGQPLFKGEGGSGGGGLFGRKQPREQAAAPSLGGLREPRVTEEPTRKAEPEIVPEGRENAMGALRGDFSDKLNRGGRGGDPLQQRWEQKLGRHGLTPRLIRALVDEGHEYAGRGDEVDQLAWALSKTLRFAPLNIMRDVPIMLIGQTGAGKTSSAAKIAASAAAQGGSLAFISADVGRAGAVEQMQTYADALDTRFWAVEEPRQVAQIMRQERPGEGIILDTPGVSPFASADVAAVRAFRESLGAEMILVIPASGDVGEHADWVSAFADLGVRRCIITKFDASRRVGAAISACYQAGMALAYFSEAPFIADGLIDAAPEYLARRLLIDVPARLGQGR